MKKILLFYVVFAIKTAFAQPVNDNCSSVIPLTVNAACINGATKNGAILATVQVGEVILPSCMSQTITQSVWYSFVATKDVMYIQQTSLITLLSTENGRWCSVVYNDSICIPTSGSIVSCATGNSQGNADQILENHLAGLIVGQTYLIQVGYANPGSGNTSINFCIKVGDDMTTGGTTCSNILGPGCGFLNPPTVPQLAACTAQYNQIPNSEGSETDTNCVSFIAQSADVTVQVANNGTCGGGLISANWSVYNTSCGLPFQSASLFADNIINGLVPGDMYIFCIIMKIPSNCFYVWYKEYFVGAFTLPIELTYFTGILDGNVVRLDWETESEMNNDFFSIERSVDGVTSQSIATVDGSGTSTIAHKYSTVDANPLPGTSYYRLAQVDFNGSGSYSNVISITRMNDLVISVNESQITVTGSDKSMEVSVFSLLGTLMTTQTGMDIHIGTESWPMGQYIVSVTTSTGNKVGRVMKTNASLLNSALGSEQKIAPAAQISSSSEEFSTEVHKVE